MNLLPFQKIKYQLYLLQLENYNLPRFSKIFWRKFKTQRNKIDWTAKLKTIFLIAFLIQFILAITGGWMMYLSQSLTVAIITAVIILYLLSLYFGICLILATIILWPLDYILKQKIINKAKTKIKQYPELKIVGITGSYGKTTMKETVAEILSQKYKVLKTEENKNTPLGISQLILEKLDNNIDILIVEMGAYQKGDIKTLCDITKPNFSILTGINESHLERFGSIKNTVLAKFEIVVNAVKDAKIILNADNNLIKENYKKYLNKKETFFYSSENNKLSKYQISNKNFFMDGSGIAFDLGNFSNLKISILGEYMLGTTMAGVILAEELGLTKEEIKQGIKNIKPIKHRLQLIKGNNNILVIDDSYNGNTDGVREAIKVLAKFKDKRRIYVTPGLVETGDKNKELHYNIGKQLSSVANVVILIKNSATPFIEQGLLENNFIKENIIFFNSAPEAHQNIQNITKSGDVILFQNDWPENYI